MFPRLRQQLLARADLLVELATLGEYGVDDHGSVMELEPAQPARLPRLRDRCGEATRFQLCDQRGREAITASGRDARAHS
jgi:hypothetical protein